MDVADELLRAMHRPGAAARLWTAPEAARLVGLPPGVAMRLLGLAVGDGLVECVRHRFFRLTGPARALLDLGSPAERPGARRLRHP
jgi:hypothetical protein